MYLFVNKEMSAVLVDHRLIIKRKHKAWRISDSEQRTETKIYLFIDMCLLIPFSQAGYNTRSIF